MRFRLAQNQGQRGSFSSVRCFSFQCFVGNGEEWLSVERLGQIIFCSENQELLDLAHRVLELGVEPKPYTPSTLARKVRELSINQTERKRLLPQQNITRDDAITAIRFPIRLLTVACLLTIMALAGFGWIIFDNLRDAKMFTTQVSRIEELRGIIVHLDEVLTMSARMAATAGDSRWEERYRHFEPQLDAALKETKKIEINPSNVKAANKTDAANIKLVEMENRAFALVRAGRKEEAQTVLFSPEYETQKQIYAEGITSFTNQIRREVDEGLRKEQRIDLLSIIAALVVGGISLLAWLSAALGVRRWRGQLLDSFHQHAEADENLRKTHAELGVRVKERTADLAQTNETLQALRRQYELILQSVGEGIHGIGLDGKIIFENAAAARLLGRSAEDLIGRPAHETIHHSHRDGSLYPKEKCPIYQTLRDGVVRHSSKEFFWRSDGSSFPVDYVSAPLRDEHGEIAGGVVTFRDITERREAEEALRRQEKQYRILFQTHPNPTWVYDATTFAFLAVNDAAVEHYGYSREEFLEMTIRDIRPQEDVPALIEASNVSAVKGKGVQPRHSGIWRHRKKSGEILFADIYTTNIQFEGRAAHLAIAIDITEKKKAEDAIRESEERMRSVLESALDCVIAMDHQGRIVEFNPAAEKTFGYKRDEAIGQSLADLIIPPSLRKRHQRGLTHYLSTGEAPVLGKRIELTGMRRDKSEFPIELAITRIGSQEPPMFTGFIRDITERKDAEKHRAQMEGRYRGLLEAAPDAMVVVNQDGEIVLLNLQTEKQFGYRRDELVGQKVKNIIPEGFAERLVADDLRSTEDALAQRIGTGIELTGRRKNGSDFPIEIMLSPLESADGILVTAAIRDITERKRAEERLREQADMLNRAHDAIIIRNFADQRITFWNAGAERLYGWSANEAMGRPIGELLVADPREVETYTKIIGSTGEFHGEVKQRTKDGEEIIVDGRATLINNPDGTPRSVLLINTDVTEQKKLETHLLRAQRLESIGTLASGVAHDLNNILTPILICAEVLKGNPVREDLPALVSMIEESAKRGANVVKQVLTFARGVEGEHVVIKPSHLIQEMIDIAQKTFPKTIEILGRYPDDLWSIKCDPTQLHQVLVNLSVNARDAMSNGGTITIGAENFDVDEHYASMTPGARPGPHVMFRVCDTGSGMSRAVIDKIFDPFFTTKEIGKGTGLGLSTVLGIVKSHGGFISVDSEPGKGTTFKVFLLATTTDEDIRQSKTSVVPIQGNGELILVVDDEPNILGITKMILEKHNYNVLSANDGPEALAIFVQQMPSIRAVLTDVSMPYMDGVMLARALRKMKPDVPVIASTGQGETPGAAEFQTLGVKNFLTKPYDTEKLLATVHKTLEGHESLT
jgi:PAS domain S-box-containing protein